MTIDAHALKSTFSEAFALLALGAGLALAVNAVSPRGIAVTHALPLKDLDPRYITAEEAKARFDAGRTIFVDARKPEEFARGHIEGALNVSVESFAARYAEAAKAMPTENDYVVYCGGDDCGQSRQLAGEMAPLGYPPDRVKIFRGGWKEWKARGWPSDTGPGEKGPQRRGER